jgi:hypothetical protein
MQNFVQSRLRAVGYRLSECSQLGQFLWPAFHGFASSTPLGSLAHTMCNLVFVALANFCGLLSMALPAAAL